MIFDIYKKYSDVIVNIDKRLRESTNKKRQYYCIYTILFLLGIISFYFILIINGKTNIWYIDGYEQHYLAYIYNGRYWREFLRELIFNHRFVLKEWEYALGEGGDILSTLHFYVIGDPFTIPTIFIPTSYMWVYYYISVILRMYFAGVAFSYMVFNIVKKAERYPTLIGALAYSLCFWALYCSVRHPGFINPLIYMPLVIVGVEKIIKKESSLIFIGAVFLLAISNFYFFYVQVLLTVIYVGVRLLYEYKGDWKKILFTIVKIGLYALLAVCLAAVIVLPILYSYIGDKRMDGVLEISPLYEYIYYKKIPRFFLGVGVDGKWTLISMIPFVFLTCIYFFIADKKHKVLKALLLISGIFLLFPIFGQFFNVLTYKTNRWSFIVSLLSAFTCVVVWKKFENIDEKNKNKLTAILVIYFMLCIFLDVSRTIDVLAEIVMAFICLVIISQRNNKTGDKYFVAKRNKQIAVLMILYVTLIFRSIVLFGTYYHNYASELKDIKEVQNQTIKNEVLAIKTVEDGKNIDPYSRYSGKELNQNAGMLQGISGTTFYWSTSNPKISEFRNSLDMEETLTYSYKSYDDKAILLALNGIKYYCVPIDNTDAIPYGYKYLKTVDVNKRNNEFKGEYKVYKSDNILPLAFTYDNVMDKNNWDDLLSIDKMETMLETCVLEDYQGNIKENLKDDITDNYEEGTIKIDKSTIPEGLYIKDNKIIVTKKNLSMQFTLDGVKESETYLYMDGFKYTYKYEYDFYFDSAIRDNKELSSDLRWSELSQSEKERIREQHNRYYKPNQSDVLIKHASLSDKTIELYTKDYPYYNERDKYLINLNYSEEPLNKFYMVFSETGVYEYDEIKVFYRNMSGFDKKIRELKKNSLQNVYMGTDTITGNITVDKDKMLYINVPYSKGWTAYVDGEKENIYAANEKNMAIELKSGSHKIKLIYHTPLLRIGIIISFFSFVGLIGFIIIQQILYKKYNIKKEL